MPGDASGLGNQLAYVAAVRVENLLFAHEHILQLEAIGFQEGSLKYRARNFEADEIVIAVWRVAFPRDLENVKAKFGFHVRQPVILKGNAVAKFLTETRIQNRNGPVGAKAVPSVVRGIVRKRANGESVLVEILGVAQQSLDEIAAADVMR